MSVFQLILIISLLVNQVLLYSGYVEKSNPYITGKLHNATFTLSTKENAPLHTTVIYPTEAGEYPLYYFIPGGPEGIIPAEWYTDVLERVVSHGFIVAAVDPFYPLITSPLSEESLKSVVSNNMKHLKWLKENLGKYLKPTIKPMLNHIALGCHSAGCEPTLGMIQEDTAIVNSTIFLEPFSISLKKKSGIKMPAYMYGTQLSEEFGPFPCSLPGLDYRSFYNQWGCPKWLTEVADFGHCDILDEFPWESCHIGHFCKTVGNWSRVYPSYHQYVSGAMSAFLIGTLQNHIEAFQYIQNSTLIPKKLLSINHTMSC